MKHAFLKHHSHRHAHFSAPAFFGAAGLIAAALALLVTSLLGLLGAEAFLLENRIAIILGCVIVGLAGASVIFEDRRA